MSRPALRGRPEHAQPRSNSGRQDRAPSAAKALFLFVRPPSLPLPLQRAPRPAWKQHTPVSGDASSCAMGPVKPLFWFAYSFLSRVIEGDGPENNTHGAKRVREERKPREGLVTDAGHCSAPTLSHQPSGYPDSTQQRKGAESADKTNLRIKVMHEGTLRTP